MGNIRLAVIILLNIFHGWLCVPRGIRVQNFFYDGTAPAAYFWAGSTSRPGQNGHILPYPYTGTFYRPSKILTSAMKFFPIRYLISDSIKAPELERMSNVTVNLRLPPELPLSEVRWISVWCRTFRVDFGSIEFP